MKLSCCCCSCVLPLESTIPAPERIPVLPFIWQHTSHISPTVPDSNCCCTTPAKYLNFCCSGLCVHRAAMEWVYLSDWWENTLSIESFTLASMHSHLCERYLPICWAYQIGFYESQWLEAIFFHLHLDWRSKCWEQFRFSHRMDGHRPTIFPGPLCWLTALSWVETMLMERKNIYTKQGENLILLPWEMKNNY